MNSPPVASPAGNRWAVVLSNRAVKELRRLERDQNALEIIHKKIKELSMGVFSMDNHRCLQGTMQHIPIYRARAANNLRIVYQVDVSPDSSGSNLVQVNCGPIRQFDHQVIKIFRVTPRAQVDYAFWVKVSIRLKRVNPEYRDRCAFRLPERSNDKLRPAMFPHVEYGLGISNQDSGFLLNDLTAEENEEIQDITMERFAPLNKSLYNSIAADLDMAFPMVLDEHERKIINHSGASLVIGRSGTGKTTALIYKMRVVDQTNTTRGYSCMPRQLFITRSRVLAQHVEATYQGLIEFTNIAFKSSEQLKQMAKQSRDDPDRVLVEFDSEIDLRNDLPSRFGDLQDHHFPLFISFDKLCDLLEADIRHILPNQIGSSTSRKIIGYDEFLHNYWPSFRTLGQSLEPNLVYSEIIGVIKGSQAALESKEGFLTRDQYVNTLSRRQFPLLAHVRDRVYSIFEAYTKNKAARHETDAADRTRLILRHIQQTIRDSQVDYLYIDEVQDNLMIDIHLLRNLAKSMDNIYWSGDSAQTVVAGSAFRINDLKAFAYRDQTMESTQSPRRATSQLTSFELNVNFRSLSGIVRFAGYIVESIHGLFPESIDRMEPEKAKHYGDPPILFTDIRDEAGYFENFLLGSSASNRVVFGAQQAILVRDAAAAEELDNRLQGLCNVLPIMDSKGLEFDDVLIYNFFSESPASSLAWDHLLGTVRGSQSPPPVLCSELKLLYVAMTRARRRCWMWDSGDAIQRLKTLWVSRGLVKLELASKMIGRLSVTSSKEQWVAKGREYFSHRLYKLASACFRQAHQPKEARLSTAYHLMSRAKLKRLRGDNPVIHKELTAAAQELEDCARQMPTGSRANIHYHAATCYELAREWTKSSAAYIESGRHAYGVQLLFTAREFVQAARSLVKNRQHLEPSLFESLREQARSHFFNRHEYRELGPLFDSVDDKIDYARVHKYKTQLKRILDEHKRYDELADEHLQEQDIEHGVKYFTLAYRHHRTVPSIKRATEITLGYIDSTVILEGSYRKSSNDLAKSLVRMIQPFAAQTDSDSCQMVDLLYGSMVTGQVNVELARVWSRGDADLQQPRHLLARYLALKDHSWLNDHSVDVVIQYLDIWNLFISDMISLGGSNSDSKAAQRLLGFSPDGLTSRGKKPTYSISEQSILYQPTRKFVEDDETEILASHLNPVIREEVPKRLYCLLESLHAAALASPWVSPQKLSASPLPTSYRPNPKLAITSEYSSGPKMLVVSRIIDVLDVSKKTLRGFSDLTVSSQSWLGRVFTLIYATTGELQSFVGLNAHIYSANDYKHLSDWLRRDQNILRRAKTSDTSISHALMHMLVRSSLYYGLLKRRSQSLVPIESFQDASFESYIVRPLQCFLFETDFSRFTAAINALEYIMGKARQLDANVIVTYVETLVRNTMLHTKGYADFSQILMPFSWMLSLACRYADAHVQGDTAHVSKLISLAEQLSLELRFGDPGRWHVGRKPGSPSEIDMLNLRLCWCIALVIGALDEVDQDLQPAIRVLQRLSSDDMPPEYSHRHSSYAGLYHEFSKVTDKNSALLVLSQTFHHESLVLVLTDPSQSHPAEFLDSVHKVICSESSKLFNMLEGIARGELPDSSDEESESAYEYEQSEPDYEQDPDEYEDHDPYPTFEEEHYEPSEYASDSDEEVNYSWFRSG